MIKKVDLRAACLPVPVCVFVYKFTGVSVCVPLLLLNRE